MQGRLGAHATTMPTTTLPLAALTPHGQLSDEVPLPTDQHQAASTVSMAVRGMLAGARYAQQ